MCKLCMLIGIASRFTRDGELITAIYSIDICTLIHMQCYCNYPLFSWFAVIVYAVFIFTITIIFGSIVIAQFTTIYATTRKQAVIYVMLNKCAIMGEMDALLSVIHQTLVKCIVICYTIAKGFSQLLFFNNCNACLKVWQMNERGSVYTLLTHTHCRSAGE